MSDERNSRRNVLQPGISISSRNSTNGTLGLIVFDRKNNHAPCILSNWHVLAARKPKSFGWSLKPGAVVYQPGKIKGGKKRKNVVAKLVRSSLLLDCAISRIIEREFTLDIFESGITITSTRLPVVGDFVEKSGTRSGVTQAKVKSVEGDWVHLEPVEKGNPGGIEISKSGDSGSVWYDPETGEGLLLHSEGDSDDNVHIETASGLILQKVLDELDVSLQPKEG
ncbi:MAG: hypothetical protein ACI8ZM_001315 [Crocinitomix sp.]|jgi:hypothetical protein